MAQVGGVGPTSPAGKPAGADKTETIDLNTVGGNLKLAMIVAAADPLEARTIESNVESAKKMGVTKVRVPTYEAVTHRKLSEAHQRIMRDIQNRITKQFR